MGWCGVMWCGEGGVVMGAVAIGTADRVGSWTCEWAYR